MSETMAYLLVLYTLVAVLLAFGLQSAMRQEDRSDRLQVLVATVLCALWPITPLLVALMRWDLKRMKGNR